MRVNKLVGSSTFENIIPTSKKSKGVAFKVNFYE